MSSRTEDLTQRVEAELRDILSSRAMPLYKMMSYHLGWEDRYGHPEPGGNSERTHGVACLTVCLAAGGEIGMALPAAAAVEMVNSFVQVHDDVQGGHPQRHSRDAVWWVWGPAQAINAGDGMHALARLALFRLLDKGVSPEKTFRATQLLDEASLALCEGRFQDLEAQERIDMSVQAYLRMAAAKTGALLSCAMKLGALLARDDEDVVGALGECGMKVGLAMQVVEDVHELWGWGDRDTAPGHEVTNKKKLLPVAYAMEKASLREKRKLGDIYFKRVLEPQDVAAVRQVVEDLGARRYCEDLVEQYHAEAIAALAPAQLTEDGVQAVKEFTASVLGELG